CAAGVHLYATKKKPRLRAALITLQSIRTLGLKPPYPRLRRHDLKSCPSRSWYSLRSCGTLELVPQELVVHLVVELDFRSLHDGPEQARATVCGSLLQVGVASLHIVAQYLRRPLRLPEILECGVNVVRQVALRLAQVLDLRDFAVDAALKDRVHHQVRIRVRTHRANFDAHGAVVADRNADHG